MNVASRASRTRAFGWPARLAACVTLAREGARLEGDGRSVSGNGASNDRSLRAARAIALGAALAVSPVRGRRARAQHDANAIPSANGAGFDTHLFRPAMDSKGLFSVNGTRHPRHERHQLRPGPRLRRTTCSATPDAATQLIEHSFQGTFQFNYGIANIVVVGLDLPDRPDERATSSVDATGAAALPGPVGPRQARLPGRRLRRARTPSGASCGSSTASASRSGCSSAQALSDAAANARRRPGLLRTGRSSSSRSASARPASFGIARQRRLPRAHGRATRRSPLQGRQVRRRQPLHLRRRRRATACSSRSTSSPRRTARTSSRAAPTAASSSSNEVVGGIKLFVERNCYLMLGGGVALHARASRPPTCARSSASSSSRRSATATATASRTTSTSARTIPRTSTASRTRTAAPIPTTTTTASSTSTTAARTSPRTATATRTRTAAPRARRRPRRRRHPRRARQVPRRARGPRRLPGRGRLPRSRQRQGRHPRRGRPVPERSRGQGRLRGRGRLPRSGQRQGRHPRREGQVPERAGDLQRLRGRGRLPRQGQRHHPGQRHRHPRQDQVRDGAARRSCPSRSRSSTPSRRRSTHHPEFTLLEVAGHADERATTSTTCKLTQDRVELGHARAHRSAASSGRASRSKGYGEYCPLEDRRTTRRRGKRTAASSSRSSRRRTAPRASSSAARTPPRTA